MMMIERQGHSEIFIDILSNVCSHSHSLVRPTRRGPPLCSGPRWWFSLNLFLLGHIIYILKHNGLGTPLVVPALPIPWIPGSLPGGWVGQQLTS
jgi:hypothetical protein